MDSENRFEWLDGISECVRKGGVSVIGGRPGMGKTALSLNIAADALNYGERVVICVASTDKADILCRLYSVISGVGYFKISNEDTDEKETAELESALNTVGKWESEGLLAIITDYCFRSSLGYDIIKKSIGGYLFFADDINRYVCGNEECGVMCRELKKFADYTDTAVVLNTSVSRKIEKRTDCHPRQSDMKYYKAIKEYTDKTVLIYRDAYYNEDGADTAELLITDAHTGAFCRREYKWTGRNLRFSKTAGK